MNNSAEHTETAVANAKPFAVASLVLGILALVSCCCCLVVFAFPFLALFGIGAIVCALIAKRKAGKFTGMILAGLILGIIAMVMLVVSIIVFASFMTMPIEEIKKAIMESVKNGQLDEETAAKAIDFLEKFKSGKLA